MNAMLQTFERSQTSVTHQTLFLPVSFQPKAKEQGGDNARGRIRKSSQTWHDKYEDM